MAQWIKTNFPGIRYREHETRKNGIRKDRYFTVRYKLDGKDKEEGLGWSSQGWTAQKAAERLADLKQAQRTGEGATSLAEKRRQARQRRAEEQREQERTKREEISLERFFLDTYLPISETGKKAVTCRKEREHFRNWIRPTIGHLPFKDIKPFAIEKLKKSIIDGGKSPRTLQYVFATVRQVWNMARRDGLVTGDSPTKQVKVPKIDNRRVRFLNHSQAGQLLEAVKAKDSMTHDICLLSLHCGLRLGEITNLKWGHIDQERGIITVMDAKGDKGRAAFMTQAVREMFGGMTAREHDAAVFTRRRGDVLEPLPDNWSPKTFTAAVKELGFNNGVSDRRQQICFHTLRHTFASWHVESGTDLYVVKELMGHSVIAMTERYSHLAPATLQNATRNLERSIEKAADVAEAEIAEYN